MTSSVLGDPRTILSPDGTRIGVVEHLPPESDRRSAPVLFVPALGVPLGYYSRMLSAWAGSGRRIVAVELRGMPLTPLPRVRDQRYGYSALIRNDLPAVVDALLPRAGSFVAVGHSLGGQLALLATATRSIRPSAVATIASGTSSAAAHADPLRRAGRRAQIGFVAAASALCGYWPGDRLGFGGRQPRSLMRDWSSEAAHGRYRLHGDDIDYDAALSALETPLLLLTLEGDTLITPLAAEHLRRRLPAHAESREIPRSHDPGSRHLRWARAGWQPVTDAVDAWAPGGAIGPRDLSA